MCNQAQNNMNSGFYLGAPKPVVSLIKLLGGKPDVPCPCALCVLKRGETRIYNCVGYRNPYYANSEMAALQNQHMLGNYAGPYAGMSSAAGNIR